MALDKFVLILIIAVGALWCAVMLASVIAVFPYGLPILAIFLIVGYVFYRVVRDRMKNKEDDYYIKNVKR